MSEEVAQALADLAAAQQLWQELKAITAEHARLRAELEAARAFISAIRAVMIIGGWRDELSALLYAYDEAAKARSE